MPLRIMTRHTDTAAPHPRFGSAASSGPGDSMLTYSVYLFQNAFLFLKMGYASALAVLLFMVVLLVTLSIFRSARLWVFQEDEEQMA